MVTHQSEDHKNSAGKIILACLLFSIGYAILRYHIFGPVPWKDFPFFILNKGISLGAFILLTLNFSLGPLNNLSVKVPEGWLNAQGGWHDWFLARAYPCSDEFHAFQSKCIRKVFQSGRHADAFGRSQYARGCFILCHSLGLQP